LNKEILFWNIEMKCLFRRIQVKGVSVHSLVYLHDFQVLAAASFANSIQLWSFAEEDIITVGSLIGHLSQVVCIQALVDTPLLISADEFGMIKTWDVRTKKCVQSYLSESRTVFKNIINIDSD
jgi:WD40 repeat protein